MAWDPIGEGRYTGDEALDAWGGALDDAVKAAARAGGRKPTLAGLLGCWGWPMGVRTGAGP